MDKIGVPRIMSTFKLRGVNHFMALAEELDGVIISFFVNFNSRTRKCTWHKNPIFDFAYHSHVQLNDDLISLSNEEDPMTVTRYSGIFKPG